MRPRFKRAAVLLLALSGCGGAPRGGSGPDSARGDSGDLGRSRRSESGTNEPTPGAEAREPNATDAPSATQSSVATSTADGASGMREGGEPAAEVSAPPSITLPRGARILQVGDSFAGALGPPLSRLLEAEGVTSVLEHTDASYLTDWAWDGKLQKLIWKVNPDLVMITLGANELEIAQPEQRARTVKKLISLIGDRPCLWVAIPLWAGPKNGLLEVIRQNVGPCRYLDTNQLMDVAKMARIKDGIHPTSEARQQWAKVTLDWLHQEVQSAPGRPLALRVQP